MSPYQKAAVWLIAIVLVGGPFLGWLTARRPPRFIALHIGRAFYDHSLSHSQVYVFDQPCSRVLASMKEELRTGGWQMVTESHKRGLVVMYAKNASGESITLVSPDQFDNPVPKGTACVVAVDTIF